MLSPEGVIFREMGFLTSESRITSSPATVGREIPPALIVGDIQLVVPSFGSIRTVGEAHVETQFHAFRRRQEIG